MKKFSMFMLILVAAFAAGSVSAQVLNGNFEGGTDPGAFTTHMLSIIRISTTGQSPVEALIISAATG